MNWQAPQVEITVGETTMMANVSSMTVDAGRGKPIATVVLEMSNVQFEWDDIEDGDALVIRWGYRGDDLNALFVGSVKARHVMETVRITGQCRCRQLVDTLVTRTYHNEAAEAIVAHLVSGMEFTDTDLQAEATEIDKLPLQDDTALAGLLWLNRRLGLEREVWSDQEGVFHWRTPDETQAPSASFTHGQDILEWKTLATGQKRLTALRTDLWHSEVVEVLDADGGATNYIVDRVRHMAGGKAGLRSVLWLSEVEE